MTNITALNTTATYSQVSAVSTVDSFSTEKDPIQALLNSLEGDRNVSNKDVVDNLIVLLKNIQSLLLNLQESHSSKASMDSDMQKSLIEMGKLLEEANDKAFADYLKKLEDSKKSSFIKDLFGAVLPFLTLVFPPLLALYPLGPVSLLMNPNSPFGMGVVGQAVEDKWGKGAAQGLMIGIEVAMVITTTILTCGGAGALKAGGAAAKQAFLTKLSSELKKDLALYIVAKAATHEETLKQLTNMIIKLGEKIKGEELSETEKASIHATVSFIVQIVVMIAVIKVKAPSKKDAALDKSNPLNSGSILDGLPKSVKLQKIMTPLMFAIDGAQAGIQIWGGINTIEVSKAQATIKEISAQLTELKGADAAQKTKAQNSIKEMRRALDLIDPSKLDLEKVAGNGSKAAKVL